MRGISVLGSTGSIGTQTLDVIRRNNDIKVVALAAGTRVKELANQVREFRPELVCIGSEKLAAELKVLLAKTEFKAFALQEENERLKAELAKYCDAPVVVWRTHPFDYGIGHEGVYASTHFKEQSEVWNRKGWRVEELIVKPGEEK